MFCPKCGSQNADETKFCRGCGADLSKVLAVMAPTTKPFGYHTSDRRGAEAAEPLAEKEINLRSRGWLGLVGGLEFLIVAGLGFGLSERTWVMGFFGLMFAFFFLAASVGRFVQARGLKQLREQRGLENGPALSPGSVDYLQPARSLFATDDLTATPRSVTEHTTTRLQLDRDTENR